ncbi:MAG: hypothetical protein WAW39_03775 [Prosthecobacter sp.]|uniref:hypothetical protein n=1 Tax=Prosthecobacter sp. TaxID=1965333 RepID=UPI003BAF99A2
MNYPCIFTALAGILLAASCDKNESMSKQQAGLEAEFLQGNEELRQLDAELVHGTNTIDLNVLTQQDMEWVKYNAAIEQALAGLKKKCTQGDDLLKKVQSKLDAYKGLNAQ